MLENTIIKFTGDNKVEVILEENGVKKVKVISLMDFTNVLNASVKKKEIKFNDIQVSCIFPAWKHIHTVQHIKCEDASEIFILLRDNKPIDMIYENTSFENVGLPNLLFAIRIFKGALQWIKVAAVDIAYITEDTEIYFYPFSHVSSPVNTACLGGNRFSDEDFKLISSSMIYKIPDQFLSMPNGNDYYHDLNLSDMNMRPLLEKLSNNEFPKEWLKKFNKKYGQWINEIY